jgi:hypothetical protein
MTPLLFVAAALAFWFWPRGASVPKRLPEVPAADVLFRVPPQAPAPAPPAPPPTADARAAIDSLLDVRDTLDRSGPVDPESSKAIDRLWLDLLHSKKGQS